MLTPRVPLFDTLKTKDLQASQTGKNDAINLPSEEILRRTILIINRMRQVQISWASFCI